MIDLYCERTASGLWAEPLNALTNLAFLVAAWLCWQRAAVTHKGYVSIYLLIGLAAAVGIGSGLFHTFATRWAMWCDVIPILIFQLVFIGCYFRFVQGYGYVRLGVIYASFFGLAYLCGQTPELLNGSLTYAPAWVMLALAGVSHYLTNKPARHTLLLATGVFMLSLTFRSIDMMVCEEITIGSHFLWHLFNALLIYLVVRVYMDSLVENVPSSAAR